MTKHLHAGSEVAGYDIKYSDVKVQQLGVIKLRPCSAECMHVERVCKANPEVLITHPPAS